jgi:hypothetical protein
MIAKFIGTTTTGFKTNLEYNIETMLINNLIYVKDKLGNSFCTYYSIEEFINDWEIKKIN